MIKVVIQNMDSVHLSGSARRVKSQARRRFSSSYPVNDRIGSVGCIYSVQAVDQRFLLVAEERRQVPAAPSEHPPAFSEAAMPVLEASTRA